MNPRGLDAAFAFGVIAVIVAIIGLWLFGGCTLHNPPPCTPGTYPDPCSYGITETTTDASSD